jgi:hypothetical protein
MKKLLFVTALLIALTSCKNKDANVESVKFPPPAVKTDEELQTADPGEKSQKGDPNADINIDAPVGNSDTKVTEAEINGNGTNHYGANNTVTDTSKKIIKDGSIQFETDNLNDTHKKILNSLKKYGGYVDEDNQTTNGDENRKEYELKIRIPAKYFDFFLDSVSSTAYKIDSKDISITDVTTRYIDVKTRLDNKKILEKRYLELLNKSSKISDLLEIENKLTEIRSDIESTQGQLNYLNKQVAYSSLDITFYTKQTAQVDTGQGAGYKFKTAIANGWQTLQNLFFGLIGLWPIVIILGVIYWLIKRWSKRRKARKAVS